MFFREDEDGVYQVMPFVTQGENDEIAYCITSWIREDYRGNDNGSQLTYELVKQISEGDYSDVCLVRHSEKSFIERCDGSEAGDIDTLYCWFQQEDNPVRDSFKDVGGIGEGMFVYYPEKPDKMYEDWRDLI
jgi:hypothetical protein